MARARPYTWDDLIGAELVWLVTVEIGGAVHRWSSAPIVVSASTNGVATTQRFDAVLEDLEIGIDAEPYGEGDLEPTVQLSASFGQDGAGFGDVVADLADPGGGECEIALIRVGDTWEERDPVFRGRVESIEHGGQADPVDLVVSVAIVTDGTVVPSYDEVVNDDRFYQDGAGPSTTWTYDANLAGQAFPIPIGYPGAIRNGDPDNLNVLTVAGTPALLVRIDPTSRDNSTSTVPTAGRVLIAAGATDVGQRGGDVTIYNDTKGTTTTVAVVQDRFVGAAIDTAVTSYCNISAATMPIDEGDELWCRYDDISSRGGGILRPQGDGPLRGAGEVTRWLLDRARIPFDSQGSRAAIEALDAYHLDFYWNTHRPPWQVIVEDILPFAPVGWELGTRGVRLFVWPTRATHTDATFRVDVDRAGTRITPVRRSPRSEVQNELTLEYWYNPRGDQYMRRLTLGWDRSRITETDPVYRLHPDALASHGRYGPRPGEVVPCPSVQDPTTAQAVASYLLWKRAHTWREIAYRLPRVYQSVRNGEVGLLTDRRVGIQDLLVVAHSPVRTTDDTVLQLRELPDWIRDSNRTPG